MVVPFKTFNTPEDVKIQPKWRKKLDCSDFSLSEVLRLINDQRFGIKTIKPQIYLF